MDIQYQEKVPSSNVVLAILTLTVLIVIVAGANAFMNPDPEMSLGVKIFVIIVFLVAMIVLISFRSLSIVVTNQTIEFGFGKFRRKRGLGKIKAVEIRDFKFSNYFGYGIRFGRDGTIGYVPRGGKGVVITFADEKRPYFISTLTPEQLVEILKRYVK
jgi:hypothetical protein